MDSKNLLYKVVGTDEAYTPAYGVKPILKYIPKDIIVWCPFDKEDSEFVRQIKQTNKVVYSHIHMNGSVHARITNTNYDFFKYEPKKWDIIISNPPFKNKRKFFERALSFKKPFALIMTNTWLNDSSSKTVFSEVDCQLQLLMFDDRMKFTNPDGRPNNKITFSSSYFCYKFLPTDLILGGKLQQSKG